MKAVVAAFNQEKALVGAFSVIVKPVVEPMKHYTALVLLQLLPPSLPLHQGHGLIVTSILGILGLHGIVVFRDQVEVTVPQVVLK